MRTFMKPWAQSEDIRKTKVQSQTRITFIYLWKAYGFCGFGNSCGPPPTLFENIYYLFFFSSELKFLFEFTNQFLIIEMRTQSQFVILSSSTALGSQTGWWWSNIDCSVCIFSFVFTSARCLHYLSFWTECVPRLQPKSRRNLWSFLVQVASKYAESLNVSGQKLLFSTIFHKLNRY